MVQYNFFLWSYEKGLYFLKNKDEVKEYFVIFKNVVDNQTGITIKTLHTDYGEEYCNQATNQNTDYEYLQKIVGHKF